MAKSSKEMNEMVEQARAFLQAPSLRDARGSLDERVRKPAEEQLKVFLERFKGWSSQDLSNLREALLKKFDQEMQNAPLRINGNANPERQKLNIEMRNVFQNLFDIESSVKREESDVARVEVVGDTVAQNSEMKPAAPKTAEPSRTLLQKIKAIVDKGIQQINEKAAEVKTNMETRREAREEKRQQRKVEKEWGKLSETPLLQRIAQTAKFRIMALGEKAMEKIVKLSSKNKGSDIEMEISKPSNFEHREGNTKKPDATLAANAALHDYPSLHEEKEVKVESFNNEVIPGLTQSELDDLLKDVKSSDNPVSQEELDALLADNPQNQAEAIVEQLQQDVQGEVQKFDLLVEKELSETEKQEIDKQIEEQLGKADAPKAVSSPPELNSENAELFKELDQQIAGKKDSAAPNEFDRAMAELDSALGKIDNEASKQTAAKTSDPGTPRSGNDSGSSTPRAGQ